MIRDIEEFLGWFEGVHRRTVRDVSLLPVEAETWTPKSGADGDGEGSWGVPQLVMHTAEARGYFAGAFVGRGWVWDAWPAEIHSKDTWVPALEQSMAQLREELAGSDRLLERVELIANPGRSISGWRVLMMMAEHEVSHRAQIGAYAGLNGWPVAQLFDRDNEWVRAQRDDEIARHRAPTDR